MLRTTNTRSLGKWFDAVLTGSVGGSGRYRRTGAIRGGRVRRHRAPAPDHLSLAAEARLHELGRCLDDARRQPDGELHAGDRTGRRPAAGTARTCSSKLTWPPAGQPGYDMTGLDLRNVHLRSTDAGKTWKQVSADALQVVHERGHRRGADGTGRRHRPARRVRVLSALRSRTCRRPAILQRSTDGTKTWGKPEVLLDPAKYSTWPRRIRVLRDGRLVVLAGRGAALRPAARRAQEFSKVVEPTAGRLVRPGPAPGKGRSPRFSAEQRGGWTEEFDVAELANGDLLCVFRRASDAKRWQGMLKKSGRHLDRPEGRPVGPAAQRPAGTARHARRADSARRDQRHSLDQRRRARPGTSSTCPARPTIPAPCRPTDGRIFVFGHVGGDDAYGKVDQSIVMDSFRLASHDIAIADRKSLPADKLACERIPLGEAGRLQAVHRPAARAASCC